MDAQTLAAAMGCPLARAQSYVADFNAALVQAQCTTVNRVAMYCAQIGHESVGLRYMEEIASGAAYEGRKDLGNTQPGDGKRFKGRGPIQLTGRSNYGRFGAWAKQMGLVSDADYFVKNPALVTTSKWGFLAASWYWTVARPMNSFADNRDILGATKAVNGGTNGLADRTLRWKLCLALGNKLLPSGGGAAVQTAGGLAAVTQGVELMERITVVPPDKGENSVRVFLPGGPNAKLIVRPQLGGDGKVKAPMWVGDIYAWGQNGVGVGNNPTQIPGYDNKLTSHREYPLPGALWCDLNYSSSLAFTIDIVG